VKLKTTRLAPVLVAAGVIGLVCLLDLARFDLLEKFENITYDLRVRAAARFSPTIATNLGFVAISDDSIARINHGLLGSRFGLYWPRKIYGWLTRELSAQGASAEAFDILFAELRPDHGGVLLSDGVTVVESDKYFAQQIKRAGNVILAADQGSVPPELFRTSAMALGDISADKDSDGILRRARAFRIYRKWQPAFQQVEDDPGYGVDLRRARIEARQIILPRSEGDPIHIPLDEQGRFDLLDFSDKVPPGMTRFQKPFVEERIWHMGIVLAAQALKLDLAGAGVDLNHGRITLRGANGVERVIPVDAEGYFYINWRLTAHDPRLTEAPIEELLLQDVARSEGKTNELKTVWRDKLVVIGSSATGNDLTDRGATPLEKDTLLVSKHWNVANSILTGQFVRRSPMPVELLLIAALGAMAAFLTAKFRVLTASSLVFAGIVGYIAAAFAIYIKVRYWAPVILPVGGGFLVTHGAMLAYLVIFEQAEQRHVKSVFDKMVSPDVVNELLKLEKLSVDGASRNVTIFFSDIRGFTEMTDVNREKAEAWIKEHKLTGRAAEARFEEQARETLATVNLYLTTIAETVILHNGTIDKFIGDCVMAFWGAPMANNRHALFCVRAAIDVQRAIHRLNQEREAENLRRERENVKLAEAGQPVLPLLPILYVGTGINTGVVTAGLMGWAEQRLNYTVFGREVNLASRLEGVSGRGRIIISETTLAEIIQDDPNLALSCARLPPVKVKGIANPVTIFEVPWQEQTIPATPPNKAVTQTASRDAPADPVA
jgi:class 3 adenylate cyclase/CHASE2 domain-containing sensor protein